MALLAQFPHPDHRGVHGAIIPLFKGHNHFLTGLRASASLLHGYMEEVKRNQFNPSILWQKF
jgi:hypothetical protein